MAGSNPGGQDPAIAAANNNGTPVNNTAVPAPNANQGMVSSSTLFGAGGNPFTESFNNDPTKMTDDLQLQYNPLNSDGSLNSTYKLPDASTYTSALQQQQALLGQQGRDTAAQQGQTATSQAEQNLAMRGGSGTNNRALLENQGLKTSLGNQQQASQTAANNAANIGVQGANAQIGINQANTQNQLTAAQNVNAFNLDKYNQNMAVKSANAQADATTKASQAGGK